MSNKTCTCNPGSLDNNDGQPGCGTLDIICDCDICPVKDIGSKLNNGRNDKPNGSTGGCSSCNCSICPIKFDGGQQSARQGNTKCTCKFPSITNVQRPGNANYRNGKLASVTNLDCTCSAQQQKPKNAQSKGQTQGHTTLMETLGSFTITSDDLNYIDEIKALNEEEKRLNRELEELEHKQEAYAKTINMCGEVRPTKDVPESPETRELREIHRQLSNRNKTLNEDIQDMQLELKQLEERVNGPMRRELARERRRCQELENQLGVGTPDMTGLNKKETDFLRQQLKRTNINIRDMNDVNQGLREEVIVMNLKCDQLQNLIIIQKQNEMNTINKLTGNQ